MSERWRPASSTLRYGARLSQPVSLVLRRKRAKAVEKRMTCTCHSVVTRVREFVLFRFVPTGRFCVSFVCLSALPPSGMQSSSDFHQIGDSRTAGEQPPAEHTGVAGWSEVCPACACTHHRPSGPRRRTRPAGSPPAARLPTACLGQAPRDSFRQPPSSRNHPVKCPAPWAP